VPYDRYHGGGPDADFLLPRTVTLTLHEPGEVLLRVTGRVIVSEGEVIEETELRSIEHAIVVVPYRLSLRGRESRSRVTRGPPSAQPMAPRPPATGNSRTRVPPGAYGHECSPRPSAGAADDGSRAQDAPEPGVSSRAGL
jgi:hypothetical protein